MSLQTNPSQRGHRCPPLRGQERQPQRPLPHTCHSWWQLQRTQLLSPPLQETRGYRCHLRCGGMHCLIECHQRAGPVIPGDPGTGLLRQVTAIALSTLRTWCGFHQTMLYKQCPPSPWLCSSWVMVRSFLSGLCRALPLGSLLQPTRLWPPLTLTRPEAVGLLALATSPTSFWLWQAAVVL